MIKKLWYVVAIVMMYMFPLLAQAGGIMFIVKYQDPDNMSNFYTGYATDSFISTYEPDPDMLKGELVSPFLKRLEIEGVVIDETTIEAFVLYDDTFQGKDLYLEIVDIIEFQ